MNSPKDQVVLSAIAERVKASLDKIRAGAKYVQRDNKLTLQLEFEDEVDLAEQWMIALADCKILLKMLGEDVS